MSIIIVRELMCDTCSEWLRLEDAIRYEWHRLRKEGWSREDGDHWCPKCTKERSKK